MNEDPIQNLESIDLFGKRADGGNDLVIIVSSELKDTEEHHSLLETKIQNYVNEIISDEYISEYGEGNSKIIIKLNEHPHQAIINSIENIKNYLSEFDISIEYENV